MNRRVLSGIGATFTFATALLLAAPAQAQMVAYWNFSGTNYVAISSGLPYTGPTSCRGYYQWTYDPHAMLAMQALDRLGEHPWGQNTWDNALGREPRHLAARS